MQVILAVFVYQALPILAATAIFGSLLIYGFEDSAMAISALLAAVSRSYGAAKAIFFQTFRAEWGHYTAKRRAGLRQKERTCKNAG